MGCYWAGCTRFRGPHRITAGRLYLRAVVKVCSQQQLVAHPGREVVQLGGLVVVRPGTDADVKPGGRGEKPLFVAEYPEFLMCNMQPV